MANADDLLNDSENEEPIEDVDEEEITTPYRFTVTSYGADYPVDGLVKRLEAGDIAIPTFDPEVEPEVDVEGFQRQFVWTKPQCDRFIESLLLGLPVPGIFLVRQNDGRLLVLDGQQRLRTLATFYRGILREREFRLENIQDRYKKLTYAELAVEDRRRLDEVLHCGRLDRMARCRSGGSYGQRRQAASGRGIGQRNAPQRYGGPAALGTGRSRPRRRDGRRNPAHSL